MAYIQFGLIEASDYNNMVGGNPTTTPNTLNAVWATGGGQTGYGQSPISNVAVGQIVAATNWVSMLNTTSTAAAHQGTLLNGVVNPSTGALITYQANVIPNLTSIYTNRGNAVAQGTTVSNTQTTASSWSNSATFTFSLSFANGDAARYFFNAGGQIKLTCNHPNTANRLNTAFNELATMTGTVVMSGQNFGTKTILGNSFNGLTKVGGSGSPAVLSTNSGYFGLTSNAMFSTGTLIFDQDMSGNGYYANEIEIQYFARTNGTQGTNGDNGNIIFISCVWSKEDLIPLPGNVAAGSSCTFVAVPPSSGNISNTWGAFSISGSNSVTNF